MIDSSRPSIQIDLNEFKLHLHLKNKIQLTFHFNSPSRSFYLSVIALVVNEMKKAGKIKAIPLQEHLDVLILLNESIGGAAGSSDKENLLSRIYRKWKDALPNLEEAPLFRVLGKKKREDGDGGIGRLYSFTDEEKDEWANLFEYMGSHDHVRLKFALDKIGVGLNEISIIFKDFRNGEAWDQFISSLKQDALEESGPKEAKKEAPAVKETATLDITPREPIASEEQSPEPAIVPISQKEKKISWFLQHRWVLLIVVIVIAAGGAWKIYSRPARMEVASADRMKYPLPDRPSIAVLPFVNMSEDPKQEFLCDGITDQIITGLSKIHNLFVISRQSTFSYKSKPVTVKQVSEELGVRYVLEGGFKGSGERVRITAQLIDALTGHHIWAEMYERDLKGIFALQDEITLRILTAIRVNLTDGEQAAMSDKSYEKYLRSNQGLDCYLKISEATKFYEGQNLEEVRLARRMAEEAVAMCPQFAEAYLVLGYVAHLQYWTDIVKPPQESIQECMEMAQKALALDNSLAGAHALLGNMYALKKEYEKAIAEGERAIALSPGSALEHELYGLSLIFACRPEDAIPLLRKAIRLNPFSPPHTFMHLGLALRMIGRFEEAVAALKKAIQLRPDHIGAHINLACTYSVMGRDKEARAEAAEVLRINPMFSLDGVSKKWAVFKDPSYLHKYYIDPLRTAGLK